MTSLPDKRAKPRPGLSAQRQIVIDAAVRLFTARGVAAVSVSDICAEGDVSRPTFYRCFADKDALLDDLYTQVVDGAVQLNLSDMLDRGRAPGVALDEMVDRIFAQPELAGFLFAASSDTASPLYASVQASWDAAAARLEAVYLAGGRTPPSRWAMKATMAACRWILHDAIQRGITDEVCAEAKAAMRELMERVYGAR